VRLDRSAGQVVRQCLALIARRRRDATVNGDEALGKAGVVRARRLLVECTLVGLQAQNMDKRDPEQ